jgi:hypothetical protein
MSGGRDSVEFTPPRHREESSTKHHEATAQAHLAVD